MALIKSKFLVNSLRLCVSLTLSLLLITCTTTRVQHGLDTTSFKTISSINDAVLAISSINAMSTSSSADKQAIAKYLSIITRLEGQFRVVGVADNSYTNYQSHHRSGWQKFKTIIVSALSLIGMGSIVCIFVIIKRRKKNRFTVVSMPSDTNYSLSNDSVIESEYHTLSEK